jgi:hypothetical protein
MSTSPNFQEEQTPTSCGTGPTTGDPAMLRKLAKTQMDAGKSSPRPSPSSPSKYWALVEIHAIDGTCVASLRRHQLLDAASH